MEPTTSPAGDRTAPPDPGPGPRTPGDTGFFASLRRTALVRTQDRWIGGVCGGLGRRLGIDPLLARGLLAVTVLLGGAGLVLYGVAWALLPEEVDGRIHLEETIRGRFDAALLGAIAVVVIGLNRGDRWFGPWDGDGRGWVDGLLWAAALVAVVALLVAAANQRRAARAAGGTDGSGGAGAASGRGPVPHPGYGAVPLTHPAVPGSSPGTVPATGPVPGGSAGTVPPPPWSATAAAQSGPSGPSGPVPYRPSRPVPPPPPRPARPRVQGPGVGAVGTVVGLTLLTVAVLLVLKREGELGDLPVGLTALGIGVVLTGLAIMVAGLRGRSSGTLGFLGILGILGIVAVVPVALLAAPGDRFPLVRGTEGARIATGQTWTPQTAAEAREGIAFGFGDLVVDLTEVPLGGGVVEVPVRMSAGDLVVLVPDGAAVTGEVSLTAGEFRWDVDTPGTTGPSAGFSGFTGGQPQLYTSEEAEDGDIDLAVRITAGAGDVRVVEEDR